MYPVHDHKNFIEEFESTKDVTNILFPLKYSESNIYNQLYTILLSSFYINCEKYFTVLKLTFFV